MALTSSPTTVRADTEKTTVGAATVGAATVGAATVGAATEETTIREALTRPACLALLAPGGHGRVAATRRAVPIIIPVTFTLIDEDVIFRAGVEEGRSGAVADSVVAFETDHVGAEGAEWEVHVTGVARTLPRDTMAPGFRLSSEIITGWRNSFDRT